MENIQRVVMLVQELYLSGQRTCHSILDFWQSKDYRAEYVRRTQMHSVLVNLQTRESKGTLYYVLVEV